MAVNKKITECTELTTAPAADDQVALVDVSDTTDAANGTTKRQSWLNHIKFLFGSRFAADAGANDTYVATLDPAPAAYETGQHYRFKANTANTGACTINFNSLGAKAIKKAAGGITTDLADNDIRAGQWVDVVYDGTNMQMQSLLGNVPTAGLPFELVVACSDLTTALTAVTAQMTFPWPRNVTLSSVHAFLVTPQTSGSIFTVDVNEAGSTILSTKITIDNGETDSTSAAAAPVLSDTGLAAMAKITVDIDQVGDGTAKGLYLVFVGVYA
jgi:hypothetical protein